MQLSFYARAGHIVRHFGSVATGQYMPALGRGRVPTKRGIEHPAEPTPLIVDSDSPDGRKLLRRIKQTPNDPCMWPADEATARACGTDFVEVTLAPDGEFSATPRPQFSKPESDGAA